LYRGRLVALVAVLAMLVPASAPAAGPSFGSRTLKQGMYGKDVRVLQKLLTRAGHRTAADGRFGRGTARSVRGWERAQSRRPNARVTRGEARLLRASARARNADSGPGGTRYVKVEKATIGPDGKAIAPASAPQAVKDVIAAANEIHDKPYRYGGGHGDWKDSGYDCSGSMSYALHGGGLLARPINSTGFESYGAAGRGTWITTYANSGHSYMVVAGLRFDTSGARGRGGSRWTTEMRSSSGFVVRHPRGF